MRTVQRQDVRVMEDVPLELTAVSFSSFSLPLLSPLQKHKLYLHQQTSTRFSEADIAHTPF